MPPSSREVDCVARRRELKKYKYRFVCTLIIVKISIKEVFFINRFFTEEEIKEGKIKIADDNVHHIRNVIKLKEGEQLICVKNKKELLCTIDKIEKNSIILSVEKEIENSCLKENTFNLTLIQGFPKGDKSDFITEKAVEAGVNEIIFVNTKRSVAKIDSKNKEKKIERFSKISLSAACQSGRVIVPKVKAFEKLSEIDFSFYTLKLLCYEDEIESTLKQVLKTADTKSIAIFIGPEGGIDNKEAEYLKNEGFISISLGKRILRCETAGLYTLACVNYELNN